MLSAIGSRHRHDMQFSQGGRLAKWPPGGGAEETGEEGETKSTESLNPKRNERRIIADCA